MVEIVHGTALAFGDHGVLLRGPSGAGKSDLALRCLALADSGGLTKLPGAPRLVADDQVVVEARDGSVLVSAPAAIAGLMEVRGVGIVRVAVVACARLALVADLVAGDRVERLPAPAAHTDIAGCAIASVRLAAFEASAPLKLLLALDQVLGGRSAVDLQA